MRKPCVRVRASVRPLYVGPPVIDMGFNAALGRSEREVKTALISEEERFVSNLLLRMARCE